MKSNSKEWKADEMNDSVAIEVFQKGNDNDTNAFKTDKSL